MMLTIFGRKKKDETKNSTSSPSQQTPAPAPITGPSPDVAQATEPSQEARFAEIFHSVTEDYQRLGPSKPETVTTSLSATPEWVQPRTLPPSKPMIITPHGTKSSRDAEGWEEKEEKQQGSGPSPAPQPQPQAPYAVPTTPSNPPPTPLGVKEAPKPVQRSENRSTPQPAPIPVPQPAKSKEKDEVESHTNLESSHEADEPSIAFNESPSYDFGSFDDLSKLLAETDSALALGREKEKEFSAEKPAKMEKEVLKKDSEKTKEKEEKPPAQVKQSGDKTFKGFEHLFELTQGALDSTGLVLINGPAGSGKTTVCFGLVDRYLKQGNPCIFVSYGQAPAGVRDGLKQLGCDATTYESNYRLVIVDGYSVQSGGFSLELYSLLEPWDLAKVQESIVGNCGMFIGEKVRVLIDSIDGLSSRLSGGKESGKQLDEFVAKLKEAGATVICSCDLAGLGKEVKSWAEEGADCILELDKESGKDGKNEYSLKVARLKGTKLKSEAEEFAIETGKGLIFV